MTKCNVARQTKFFPTHDVDDDQEHHVGEGLGAVLPAVADQSNTGAFPVSFLSKCQGDRFQLDLRSSRFL